MLTIVICDDDAAQRRHLAEYVKQYARETEQEIRLSEFADGEALLTGFPRETDILLLDIEMGSPDGLETARRLRESFPELCIIFVTGYAQYALKSYSVRAFGFLPKPVSYTVLRNELALAEEQLRRRAAHYVLIRDRETNQVRQVDVRTVRYFEVRNHDILAVLERETLYYRGTMNALEKELAPFGFFRCHAAFLVNHRAISAIGADLTLSDGTVIPISRAKRKEFTAALSNYVGEML